MDHRAFADLCVGFCNNNMWPQRYADDGDDIATLSGTKGGDFYITVGETGRQIGLWEAAAILESYWLFWLLWNHLVLSMPRHGLIVISDDGERAPFRVEAGSSYEVIILALDKLLGEQNNSKRHHSRC